MPIVASRMVSTAETRSSTGRASQYAPSRLTASSGVVQVNTLSITSSLARERHPTPRKLSKRHSARASYASPRTTNERSRVKPTRNATLAAVSEHSCVLQR